MNQPQLFTQDQLTQIKTILLSVIKDLQSENAKQGFFDNPQDVPVKLHGDYLNQIKAKQDQDEKDKLYQTMLDIKNAVSQPKFINNLNEGEPDDQ